MYEHISVLYEKQFVMSPLISYLNIQTVIFSTTFLKSYIDEQVKCS